MTQDGGGMHELLGFGEEDVPAGVVGGPCCCGHEDATPDAYEAAGAHLGRDHLAAHSGGDQLGERRGLIRQDAGCGGAHDPSLPRWQSRGDAGAPICA